MIRSAIDFFKKWFLPLPSHDDLYPENEEDELDFDDDGIAEPQALEQPEPAITQAPDEVATAAAAASTPTAAESEAFKKGLLEDPDDAATATESEPDFDPADRPEPLNLHEEDFSDHIKAPEGHNERVGRSLHSHLPEDQPTAPQTPDLESTPPA